MRSMSLVMNFRENELIRPSPTTAQMERSTPDVLNYPSKITLSIWNYVSMATTPIIWSRPMWTVENCAPCDRSKLRYPSALTNEEWALVKTEIPRDRRRYSTT